MSEPSFRGAEESDLATLLQLMREYCAFDGHRFDEQRTPVALNRLLHDADLGRVWLVLDRITPVGYVVLCFGYSLEWLGRDAFIDEFYLREEYRGRGWERKTLAFVEDAARSREVTTLHLEVVGRNTTALRVYRKLGFQEHQSTFLSKWIVQDFAKPRGESRH